jgi:hypothetical protein
VAQVVEQLPSKGETLSSNASATKTDKQKIKNSVWKLGSINRLEKGKGSKMKEKKVEEKFQISYSC